MNEQLESGTLSKKTWQWCADNLTMDDMDKLLADAMVRWCEEQKAEITQGLKETIESFSATVAHQLVFENDLHSAVNTGLCSFPPTPYDHLVDDEEKLENFLAEAITAYKKENSR